jgi:hypothetical protein
MYTFGMTSEESDQWQTMLNAVIDLRFILKGGEII